MLDLTSIPPEISVVVPVWNGEHSLGRLLPRLFATLESLRAGSSEVLVVVPPDDPVAPQAERAGARVVYFESPGYGHALNTGLAAARGNWVVTMDADFSHNPEFIRAAEPPPRWAACPRSTVRPPAGSAARAPTTGPPTRPDAAAGGS